MSSTNPDWIDELIALEKRAAKAPWTLEMVKYAGSNEQYSTTYLAWAFAEPAQIGSWANAGKDPADIALVVALRNAFPRLIAAARGREVTMRELESAYQVAQHEWQRKWIENGGPTVDGDSERQAGLRAVAAACGATVVERKGKRRGK